MGTIFCAAAFGSAMLLATCASAQAQQDCSPKRIASLPMTMLADGNVAVPVRINGATEEMRIDLAGLPTLVTETYAKAAGLPQSSSLVPSLSMSGAGSSGIPYSAPSDLPTGRIDGNAEVNAFGLGAAPSRFVLMARARGFADANVVGLLGLDQLNRYDVEFDFSGMNANLYEPANCNPYEPASSVAISMRFSDTGTQPPWDEEMYFTLQLDGKEMRGGFAAASGPMKMLMSVAHHNFDLDSDAAGMSKLPQKNKVGMDMFEYPFRVLSLGDFALANPRIWIIGSDSYGTCAEDADAGDDCFSDLDLRLNMASLPMKRFYFAFGDKKLYVTAADAGK